MKRRVVVNKAGRSVIRAVFTNGKRHDFRLFKESKARLRPETELESGAGHQGIAKIYANSVLPKKRAKKNPLTAADKGFPKNNNYTLFLNHES
jgi:hypothetical protein